MKEFYSETAKKAFSIFISYMSTYSLLVWSKIFYSATDQDQKKRLDVKIDLGCKVERRRVLLFYFKFIPKYHALLRLQSSREILKQHFTTKNSEIQVLGQKN